MEFALATGEPSSSVKGAHKSHTPAAKLSHSAGASLHATHSKCDASASMRPTTTACPVAVGCSAYPAIHGDTASHRLSVKVAQACHLVAMPDWTIAALRPF